MLFMVKKLTKPYFQSVRSKNQKSVELLKNLISLQPRKKTLLGSVLLANVDLMTFLNNICPLNLEKLYLIQVKKLVNITV
ncbi:hypothetical protein D9M73_212630 [compost metagenome]